MPLGYTTNGYVTNIWPIGYALFLSPFFLLGLILKPIGLQWTEFSSNQWLLIFTNAGATLYGLSSCLFAFCALKELKVGAKHALLAATLALIGSPLFFYCFSLPNTAPPLSAFSVSLFLFFWLRQRQRPNTNAATNGTLGFLLGLAAGVRTENILFGAALLFDWVRNKTNDKTSMRDLMRSVLFATTGVLIGFSPQLIIWKLLYNSFVPPQMFNLWISGFAITDLLFSPYHGLATWTPVILLASASLLWVKNHSETAKTIFLLMLIQVLQNSCAISWWSGHSFGQRLLTNLYFPTALGLGLALDELKNKPRLIYWPVHVLAFLGTLWTMTLSIEAMIRWINLDMFVYSLETLCQWQKSGLAATLIAFKQFFHNRFLANEPAALLLAALAFAIGLTALTKAALRHKANRAGLYAIVGWVLLFNGMLLYSHAAHPPKKPVKAAFSDKDFKKLFLTQALYARWHYYFTMQNYPAAKKAVERHLEIAPNFGPALEAKELLRLQG